MRGLSRSSLLARPLAIDRPVDAVVAEDLDELADVSQPRQILQRQRLIGQQRRDHQRQRGVLGPRNRNRALQLGAPANLYAIHRPRPSPRPKRLSNFKPARPARRTPARRPASAHPAPRGRVAAPCAASNSPAAKRRAVLCASAPAPRVRRSRSSIPRRYAGLIGREAWGSKWNPKTNGSAPTAASFVEAGWLQSGTTRRKVDAAERLRQDRSNFLFQG